MIKSKLSFSLITALLALLVLPSANSVAEDFQLNKGDHVSYIGNTMADRMQHHAWLETYLHAAFPNHNLTFRNLGFSADSITTRTRSNNFGSPDQWLAKNKTDVAFCFFGYNESYAGPDGINGFKKDLAGMIDGMRAQKYNEKSAPRLVIFSPIAHENTGSPHLPDGSENNINLKIYSEAMAEVCEEKNVPFVDLFSATQKLYKSKKENLTINGIHLSDNGNKAVAKVIMSQLVKGSNKVINNTSLIEKVREAVLEKNYYWFSRYRVVDGYNVYGGRSRLAWFGQSNADVMRREMEIFDIMTANRDNAIWAAAKGKAHKVVDDNIPPVLKVRTNRPGKLENQSHPYLGGKEAISKMKIAKGMKVNLFASEEMFPEVVNPVQMAVDTDGKLFASVWPSYPHWDPTQPRLDRIVCLPDDNADGVADKCIIFADELNSITGFEFWGGGMLVAALPELWYLEDTDGDYKADKKVRMLQGMSSADTHHSANAMLIGPDGWLYWSRGIFNVVSMETPTKTYRTGASGVHRFNPRTFEIEFHFPIGPNPHGNVFDQWGYHFTNDGTSGTGSYVNIGKGRGNRQWFRKRVRPVAATGILSSSHFPKENNGNFLICNTIGFLGVLQHEVKYEGANIVAEEIEPIVYSSDPNFRPTDVEIGGDGALYISDWCNVLIGHMQHNMRDPNRDTQHGRIYRVTAEGRPLLKPMKLKGKPIPEVLNAFFANENPNRYRARLELSGRDSDKVVAELIKWTAKLSPEKPAEAQALLEALWVLEEHRKPNLALVKKTFKAEEARVRAAAIRTLGHWGQKMFKTKGTITDGWQDILIQAGRDESPLVRAEALKAAVEFEGLAAGEVIFEAATRQLDSELEAVLNYARGAIDVDAMIVDAQKRGTKLSPAAEAYALQKASPASLVKMERNDSVYEALLNRAEIPVKYRWEAIATMAKKSGHSKLDELIARIKDAEKTGKPSLADFSQMLASTDAKGSIDAVARLARNTTSGTVRLGAYTAWVNAGEAKAAWQHALQTRENLSSLLKSLKAGKHTKAREPLFSSVQKLTYELPDHLRSDKDNVVASDGPAISFEYYEPNPGQNVSNKNLDRVKPKFTGKLKYFQTFVPKGKRDAFATRQRASITIPRSGTYVFYTISDDGSRLYINGKEIVNNDGNHGPQERNGKVTLEAGIHSITVNYYDNGGGDGLRVMWKGPGFNKQRIPTSVLSPVGSGSFHSLAIDVVSAWPGHRKEKVATFTKLVLADKQTSDALDALATIPARQVADQLSQEQASGVLSSLIKRAGKATPVQRQLDSYSKLLSLGDGLSTQANSSSSAKALAQLRASIPVKANPQVMALGKEVYHRDSHCSTCHQSNGEGLPNLYPPLNGSLWATGSEDRLVKIILDGLHGTIEVNGKTYSSPPLPPMTGFRQLLNDAEIAAVATYVRNTWSNRAKPISPKKVASVRKIDRGDALSWDANALLQLHPLEDGRKIAKADPNKWVPKFVKDWKFSDFKLSEANSKKRSLANGAKVFGNLGCAQCHKLKGVGGVFGPDLATLDKKKLNPEHILRSILEPSRDVEEKYAMRSFILNTGTIVNGLVVKETNTEVHVVSDPLASDKPKVVKKSTILRATTEKASIMPEGLHQWLKKAEVLDLVHFVLKAGER